MIMSKRENLAMYLAKYIDTELERWANSEDDELEVEDIAKWIEEGIAAYENIHSVLVEVLG